MMHLVSIHHPLLAVVVCERHGGWIGARHAPSVAAEAAVAGAVAGESARGRSVVVLRCSEVVAKKKG